MLAAVVVLLSLLVITWYCWYWRRTTNVVVEHMTRTATEADITEALTAYMKQRCEAENHRWTVSNDGLTWDCSYTEDTCKNHSHWPEIPAEKSDDGRGKLYMYWDRDNRKCFLGNGDYRRKCEELGMRWDEDTQRCRVTPEYCKSKTLMYKGEDCYQDPVNMMYEKVFGKTVGRALAMTSVLSAIPTVVNWKETGAI